MAASTKMESKMLYLFLKDQNPVMDMRMDYRPAGANPNTGNMAPNTHIVPLTAESDGLLHAGMTTRIMVDTS